MAGGSGQGRGRPPRLTPAVQKRIVELVEGGNYLETAAAAVGVNRGTLHRWIAKGGDVDAAPIYRDFRAAVDRARAVAESKRVSVVVQAAEGNLVVERRTIEKDGVVTVIEKIAPPDARAAEWWLERSFPKRWGRRILEHVGPDDGPIDVNVRTNAVDVLTEKLSLMAERIEQAGAERPSNEE